MHKFDGKGTAVDDIADAVEAMPMMSQYSCVLVKDFPFETVSDTEYEKLLSLIMDLPETCVLIIYMDNTVPDKKKGGKFANLLNIAEHKGAISELNKLSLPELEKIIASGAQKRGCSIDYSECVYFINSVGDDLNLLLNELDKLCFYVKDKKITKADIDDVCIKSIEAKVFDLSKALISNNCDKAFSLLDALFLQKTEPVIITGTLISAYVDMYRAKLAVLAGERAEDASKYFNYKNKEFRLRNAAKDASGLTVAQLRVCLDELSNADELLKGSGFDSRLILEQCMSKLLLAAGNS
jgi:DNA polymerase-3 subunit delta